MSRPSRNPWHRWGSSLALALGLAAAALAAQAQTAPAAVPEIPVEEFFRKPSYQGMVMSPDQKLVAALVPANGRQNLTILDLEKRSASRITDLKTTDVSRVLWANNRRLLFTTGDQQGKEFRGSGGLFAVDVDGKNGRTLVEPFASSSSVRLVPRLTTPLKRIKGSDTEVLVTANDRSVDTLDVYRMNVQTGRKTIVNANSPGRVISWVLDGDDQPRAAISIDPRKLRWWFSYRGAEGGPWKTLSEWGPDLKNVILPLAFDPAEPGKMYVASNVGRDTLALYQFDPATGKLGEAIFADSRHDIASFLLIGSPLGEGGRLLFGGSDDEPGKLIGIRYQADKLNTVWFDEEAARVQATVDRSLPGAINTFDLSQRRALVYSRSDVDPGGWYIFDRDKRQLEQTGVQRWPGIDARLMAPMRPVSWTARDGVRIDGYLTLPRSYAPGKPVPLVLHPHGGPWAKDNWEYNAEVQFMANRGFAVLQPNFRGSTGYGAQHLTLSYKQWGGTMIDDQIDGVEWAIKQGYADPARIGVYGASYGGYSTLMAMVKRPDLFKWGINYVGVTDMFVHQDTQPAQLFSDFDDLAKILNGDGRADRALFEAQSPARQVSRIAAPVFHAYGGADQNVDFENGRVIRAAFDKAGKPYEWMFAGEEAHGYREDKNVFEFYKRFERFIKQHTPPPK